MKARFVALILLLLMLPSCSAQGVGKTPDAIAREIALHSDLLSSCVKEMEALGEDRIYVAMEAKKARGGEKPSDQDKIPRLVSYVKESDDRKEIENPVLEETLQTFGLALIFFQTGSDARRCVIFSYTKENDTGVQNGFYYSYDALPCAWWGRSAKLVKKDDRFLQLSKTGSGA